MLTLFTTPKPFRGHIAVIQRNAIRSWTLLRPTCEIILLGDDEGIAEIAAEFGARHIPDVACNEYGTPLLNDIFEKAQRVAMHDLLCYVNADIILMSDFLWAVEQVARRGRRFLMVGQRWDLDVQEQLDFGAGDWEARLRVRVASNGRLHEETGVDSFVFPRGFWGDIPPFAIGRTAWDNWLIYRARLVGAPVINATRAVTVVHQNHDYAYHPQRANGVWKGPEARCNLELAGGDSHDLRFTLRDATWALGAKGRIRPLLTAKHLRRLRYTLPILPPPPGLRNRLTRALLWLGVVLYDGLCRLRSPRAAARGIARRVRRLLSPDNGDKAEHDAENQKGAK